MSDETSVLFALVCFLLQLGIAVWLWSLATRSIAENTKMLSRLIDLLETWETDERAALTPEDQS